MLIKICHISKAFTILSLSFCLSITKNSLNKSVSPTKISYIQSKLAV